MARGAWYRRAYLAARLSESSEKAEKAHIGPWSVRVVAPGVRHARALLCWRSFDFRQWKSSLALSLKGFFSFLETDESIKHANVETVSVSTTVQNQTPKN